MKIKKIDVMLGMSVVVFLLAILLLFLRCNGSDPPAPKPKISWIETETETGKVVTVLKDTVAILRIYATNGEQGVPGINGANGADGTNGIDGKDCAFPDTFWVKPIRIKDDQIQYVILTEPIPPEGSTPDSLYVEGVVLEEDNWVYILRGDSLKIYWNYSYRDMSGQPLDTADIWFHIAYEMDGVTYSLKPRPNVTQELSLVMYGLLQGDITPCVSAYILDGENRRYSTWAKSTSYSWFARIE